MNQNQFLYRQYLQTQHWRDLKAAVLKRDGYRCTGCPATKRLTAHHMIYRFPWESSIPEDLVTLCDDCHRKRHGKPPRIRTPKPTRSKWRKRFDRSTPAQKRLMVHDWKCNRR